MKKNIIRRIRDTFSIILNRKKRFHQEDLQNPIRMPSILFLKLNQVIQSFPIQIHLNTINPEKHISRIGVMSQMIM